MIWVNNIEIVCNQKDTLSIENGTMGVTKLHDCYLNNQVRHHTLGYLGETDFDYIIFFRIFTE